MFTQARAEFATHSLRLNATAMTREDLQRFWLEIYTATVDEIPSNPTTTPEHRRVDHAREILSRWVTNFDIDRTRTGNPASSWTALNAVTEWFDHQRPVRAPSDIARQENRLYSRLWGSAAQAKAKATQLALSR